VSGISEAASSSTLPGGVLEQGEYLLHVKSEHKGLHVVNVECQWEEGVTEVGKQPLFLQRVMLHHARGSPARQSLDGGEDWLTSNLLLREAGLGYVACSVAPQSPNFVRGRLERFNVESIGMVLKGPMKGAKVVELDVRAGQQEILVAKVRRGAAMKEVRFPP
jgi:hypothetical protein